MTTSKATPTGRFGARVFLMDMNVAYVLQTRKRGPSQNDPNVVDTRPAGEVRKFLDIKDNKGIADAIRAALNGKL